MKSRNTSLLHCALVIAALIAPSGQRAAAKPATGADQDGAEAGADDEN